MKETTAYRDETESLHARVAQLEAEIATKEQRMAQLEKERADHEAVFTRLEGVIDRKHGKRRGRWSSIATGAVVLAGATVLGIAALVARRGAPVAPPAPPAPPAPAIVAAAPVPLPRPIDICARPAVHFTLAGSDGVAFAAGDRDLSGQKYRRGGERSPWLTVGGGPVYVHAVGGFMPANVGTTQLAILLMKAQGDTGGYTLAHGGKSVLEIEGSTGKHVYGRFEADVSKVEEISRPAAFGTPVVRVRGTFCLPELPGNPSDTAP